MQRKEKELMAMADKLEEEQAEVIKSQKQIKDMAVINFDGSLEHLDPAETWEIKMASC